MLYGGADRSGGVFGSDDALDASVNAMFGSFEPDILQFLVVDFRLSKQDVPFVHLLLAFFGCFTAGLLRLFLLLRFEANLSFALFDSLALRDRFRHL